MLEYLPRALRKGFDLAPDASVDAPTIRLRDATDGERGRIIGDWQRKETEFVRASARDYADEYAEQAEHTLMDAYDSGSRDPGLLAALGLYECMAGDAVQDTGLSRGSRADRCGQAPGLRRACPPALCRGHREAGRRGGGLGPAQVSSSWCCSSRSARSFRRSDPAMSWRQPCWSMPPARRRRPTWPWIREGLRFFPGGSRAGPRRRNPGQARRPAGSAA